MSQFEPGVYKKIKWLGLKGFELLVSLGLFNSALMNANETA